MEVVLGVAPKKIKKPQSRHEIYMEWWLHEAEAAGYIEWWTRHPETIDIAPSVRLPIFKDGANVGSTHLLGGLSYTPDFEIIWKGENKLHTDMWNLTKQSDAFFLSERTLDGDHRTIIDVKPDKINSKKQSSYNTFPLNQKIIWKLYGLYIQKTILYPASNSDANKTLFQKTWTPELYLEQEVYKRTTKKWTQGDSKIKWNPKININQYK